MRAARRRRGHRRVEAARRAEQLRQPEFKPQTCRSRRLRMLPCPRRCTRRILRWRCGGRSRRSPRRRSSRLPRAPRIRRRLAYTASRATCFPRQLRRPRSGSDKASDQRLVARRRPGAGLRRQHRVDLLVTSVSSIVWVSPASASWTLTPTTAPVSSHGMLGLVRQARPAVLHLRDLRVRVRPVVGSAMPDAAASPRRNVS